MLKTDSAIKCDDLSFLSSLLHADKDAILAVYLIHGRIVGNCMGLRCAYER